MTLKYLEVSEKNNGIISILGTLNNFNYDFKHKTCFSSVQHLLLKHFPLEPLVFAYVYIFTAIKIAYEKMLISPIQNIFSGVQML